MQSVSMDCGISSVRRVVRLDAMSLTQPIASAGARVRLVQSIRGHVRSVTCSANASDRVILGDSDLSVSKYCLGTMTYGNQNTEAEGHEQMSYAKDQGINFFDTAEVYPIPPAVEYAGRTEKIIGTWLKKQDRSSIILASKVAGYSLVPWTNVLRTPPRTCRVSPDQIAEAVDASLQRLQTDHLDLLQIHWPDRYVPLFGAAGYDKKLDRADEIPIEEQLRGLEAVIKAGKVRYVGVSNETSWGVSEFVNLAKTLGLPKIVSIQNAYSLNVRGNFEIDLAETCRRTNVGLLAYSPLAGGSLTGKYSKGEHPKARFNIFPGYMERYLRSNVKDAVAEYEQLAKKHGRTPVELALQWCLSRWFVASSIVGATSMEQLRENVAAFNSAPLSEEALADIAVVYKKYRDPTL